MLHDEINSYMDGKIRYMHERNYNAMHEQSNEKINIIYVYDT